MIKQLFFIAIFIISVVVIAPFSHASICKVGDKTKVLWKGSWYAATVTKEKDNKCFIHYDGYENSWDEWVGADRIKISDNPFPVGDAVTVEWKGKWWPAKVLKSEPNRWFIHYDGYASSWDEWVSKNRIKKK